MPALNLLTKCSFFLFLQSFPVVIFCFTVLTTKFYISDLQFFVDHLCKCNLQSALELLTIKDNDIKAFLKGDKIIGIQSVRNL
jgi:hypothetical protein